MFRMKKKEDKVTGLYSVTQTHVKEAATLGITPMHEGPPETYFLRIFPSCCPSSKGIQEQWSVISTGAKTKCSPMSWPGEQSVWHVLQLYSKLLFLQTCGAHAHRLAPHTGNPRRSPLEHQIVAQAGIKPMTFLL